MDKKAQGISMNVIIIAAIALLVLVILAVLVLRAGGGIAEGTSCLGVEGADCVSDDTCPDNYVRDRSKGCSEEGQICCVPLGG
jgi:hypothetical protein